MLIWVVEITPAHVYQSLYEAGRKIATPHYPQEVMRFPFLKGTRHPFRDKRWGCLSFTILKGTWHPLSRGDIGLYLLYQHCEGDWDSLR